MYPIESSISSSIFPKHNWRLIEEEHLRAFFVTNRSDYETSDWFEQASDQLDLLTFFCGGKIQNRTTNCLNSKSSLKIFKESQIETIDAVLASTQGVCALPHWGSERITWTVWWESNSLCKSLLLDSLFFKVRVSFLSQSIPLKADLFECFIWTGWPTLQERRFGALFKFFKLFS